MRAKRIVDGMKEASVVSGYLLLPAVGRHLSTRAFDAAFDDATDAFAIGERFGDADLMAYARHLQGRACIRRGENRPWPRPPRRKRCSRQWAGSCRRSSPVSSTAARLARAAASSRSPRAREWTSALAAFCDAQPQLAPFQGPCRTIAPTARASAANGRQPSKKRGARASDREGGAADSGEALYREGEIQRLRGTTRRRTRVRSARTRMVAIHNPASRCSAWSKVASPRDRLDPPRDERRHGTTTAPRFLPALVEIALAAGEIEDARSGRAGVSTSSRAAQGDVVYAKAGLARGQSFGPAATISPRCAWLRAALDACSAWARPLRRAVRA